MITLDNLFKRISDLGLSAKKVSDVTGISTGNISDWKNGRSLPTAIKLYTLADYLDCSVDYLLGRTDNPDIQTNNVFGSKITNSSVGNNSANVTVKNSNITHKAELSEQATELIKIFENLDFKEQIKLISFALELESQSLKKYRTNA